MLNCSVKKVFSMAKMKQTKKMRIATWLLTFVMLIAASAFLLTACAQADEDEDDSTVTRTDTQTFANGDFEYFDDSDGSYRIASPESWTSSAGSNDNGVSASSSVAKSGIVDTSVDWSTFIKDYNDYVYYTDLEDEDPDNPELEDAEYFTDLDNQYDIPGWDVAKAAMPDEDEDPDDEAIGTASAALNPGTHWTGSSDAATLDEENGTHVLMLHNYRSNRMGTASRYTSSSITLNAGTAAKVSVWVKTSNLTYNDGVAVDGNRGAYIQITNTVGGTTQDPLVVRNIDTSGVEDNNGWVQYTFYIRASEYASTTFSVVLGLGMQAAGTSTSYYEYVQGYAFFDDLEYEVMKSADFDTQTADIENSFSLDLSWSSDRQKIDAAALTSNEFALDLSDIAFTPFDIETGATVSAAPTSDERGNTVASYFPASDANKLIANQSSDLTNSGIKNAADLTAPTYTQALADDFENFSKLPFASQNGKVLLLYSSLGAPYTATMESSSFTLNKDEYMLVSFRVKTSALQGGTGATVTLVEGDNETVIGAVDTTTLTGVDLVDDAKKLDTENADRYEDIFDGWQQCFFFVSNTTDTDRLTFSLKFSFGPTEISGTTLSSYTEGYAAFAGFSAEKMSEEQYNIKTTGTYAVEAALTGGVDEATSAFDDPAYTRPDEIKTDLADPRNYTGVFGGSTYVGGSTLDNTGSSVDKNSVNALTTAGLLNRDYTADDRESGSGYSTELDWVKILLGDPAPTASVLTSDMWTQIFGSACTQPLLIANTVEQAYGFVANSATSISASSYLSVAVRVVLSPGTTATVYLIDTTAADFGEKNYTDTIYYKSGVSYRYDTEGNVINLDPEDPDFSARTNTLFYLQDNGLWSAEREHTGDLYYANLANYERDKETGDLLDSDGEIVYYASETEGLYYRYYDADADEYSVPVRDFTEAGVDLTGAVLQNSFNTGLSQTVTNDGDANATYYVRFFIATGDEAKNYRLEVWSGSRDGKTTNAANSFVAFDVVDYGELTSDNFNSYISETLDTFAADESYDSADALEEAYLENPDSFMKRTDGKQLVYYKYSLYDDDDYASYDADRSDSTNPYADYDPSSYENGVAFLRYNNEGSNEGGRIYYDTIVNYAANEITVESTTDDDTTDDTDDTTATPTYNVWLLASSIILAAALILTLIALLVKKLLSNIRKKSTGNKPMYDNKRKRYIRRLRLEEAERDERADDVLPDEDEISEEDIYKIESDEESAEPDADAEAGEADGSEPSDGEDK